MPIIPEKIINEVQHEIEKDFKDISSNSDSSHFADALGIMIAKMYENIPDSKRISYGITYVIKTISKMLYDSVNMPYDFAMKLYNESKDFRIKSVGLGILSYIGIENPDEILPVFAEAASSDVWEVKEFVQMFIRKITKKHPGKVQQFLMEMAKSDNPDKRRFASESLRPVAENKWINDSPEFSLAVLRLLFKEKRKYPKVSVGNNLSDLSRRHPEMIYSIVDELMQMKDKNAAFIAHRACRNLVKDDPVRVMDALGVDEYVYKERKYKRQINE